MMIDKSSARVEVLRSRWCSRILVSSLLVGSAGLAALGCAHGRAVASPAVANALKARTESLFRAYQARDVEAALRFYTADALCLYFDQPYRFDIGTPAIKARLARFLASVTEGKIESVSEMRVDADGDRAWTTRYLKAHLVVRDGTRYDLVDGWHSAVWVRRNGEWLIEYEHIGGPLKVMSPPSAPPPPPPPVATPTPTPAPVVELRDVFFDYDRWEVRPDQAAAIAYNAEILAADARLHVVIEGHCDERGTLKYNRALGQRRADAARDALVRQGIDRSRIITVSRGKEQPFELGASERAWSKNRRAHFILVK